MSFSNELYSALANFVYKEIGIIYKEHDFYRLDSRILTLKDKLSLEKEEDLLGVLQNITMPPDHKQMIIDLCTNNETYFMRDIKPFKGFATEVLGKMVEKNNGGNVSIWSCACSTGQEPYSILMTSDFFNTPSLMNKVIIEATDISKAALDKAKAAKYNSLDVQRGLPAPFLPKYFVKDETEQWLIKPEIRNKVAFKEFNILTDLFPTNKYDIIFCRNVLIYQDAENKKKILDNICRSLKPGGYLLMGAGESLLGQSLPFDQIQVNSSSFYVKNS